MTKENQHNFGKWRTFFWPIHAFELKKVLPMFFMFFCISFNYTILRDTKDALIITAPNSGAEALPFIKVWLVVPMAVLFMIIYAKLSNRLSKIGLFYAVSIPFLLFFITFSLVIYPLRDVLHPTVMADRLQAFLPTGLSGFVSIFRNWSFALFFVLAELWGSVMLSLVFWGFANDIMKIQEAKRFYALFGIGANLALLVSGPAIIWASRIRDKIAPGLDPWGYSIKILMSLVFISGLIMMFCYWWMQKFVLTDARFYDPQELAQSKKKKPSMSVTESFAYLMRSPYILLLTLLVLGYGVAINIVEVTWKSQLKLQFPNSNDYSAFMGLFSTVTGIVSVFMMLFLGGNVVRKFGWLTAAVATPIMLLITGTAFFTLVIFSGKCSALFAAFGTTPLMMAVIIGMIQNILSKSTKYALFDPTKEMAFIPLDQEQKVKGKAAIDVIGARLGKSGGSLIQQGLLVVFGSIAAITPYLAVILIVVITIWLFAAKALNKKFLALTEDTDTSKK